MVTQLIIRSQQILIEKIYGKFERAKQYLAISASRIRI